MLSARSESYDQDNRLGMKVLNTDSASQCIDDDACGLTIVCNWSEPAAQAILGRLTADDPQATYALPLVSVRCSRVSAR